MMVVLRLLSDIGRSGFDSARKWQLICDGHNYPFTSDMRMYVTASSAQGFLMILIL